MKSFLCTPGRISSGIFSLNFFARNFSSLRNLKAVHLLMTAFLVLGIGEKSYGQLYWNTNGASASWTSANWGTSPGGPFTTAWTANSDAVFNENSTVTFATTSIGNVTVAAGKTVTVTQGGTLSMNGAVRTFDIGTGSTLTWTSQAVTANSSAGITKNGTGILNLGALTWSTHMNGGFTLNDGTVIVSGAKAFGNGTMTINSGTIQSSIGNSFTPTSLTVGGNFTLTGTGDDIWGMNVSLGAATRTITNSTTTGTRTFSGIISGNSGIGLTHTGSKTTTLTGANTYDGLTTVSAGTLQLNRTGGTTIPSTNNVTVSGGTLKVSSDQTIADFNMTSGGLTVDAGVTLTITGSYSASGGTINCLGTIKLNGGSVSFPGTGVTINNGTANNISNLEVASSGTVTLTSATLIISGTTTLSSGTLAVGTNTLSIGGATAVTTGSISSSATGTVNYASTSSQTVFPGGYGNLSLSGSGAKATPASTITVAGNFNPSGGSCVVTAGGAIEVAGNFIIQTGATFNAGSFTHKVGGDMSITGDGFTAQTSTIDFNGSGTQNISIASNSNPFTFNNLTASTGGTKNFNSSLTVSGTATISAGTVVIASTKIFTTNSTVNFNGGSITATGTLIVNGTITFGTNVVSGTGAFTLSSGATLITSNATGVQGSVTTTAKTLSSTANYEFRGASTGVFTTTPTGGTVNNLTINSAGTTLDQSLSANGITTLTAGALSLPTGRILNVNGTTAVTSGSINGSSGSFVNFQGSLAQTIFPGTYGNLVADLAFAKATPASTVVCLNTFTAQGGSTVTANGAVQAAGNFTVSAGATFNAGSFTHTVGGNFNVSAGTYVKQTSTLTFNGTTQTIFGTPALYNLTINSGSSVTASTNPTVSNIWTNNGTFNSAATYNNTTAYNGSGAWSGSLFNNTTGTVSPGNSPGCQTYSNGYTTSGSLDIEVNGTTPCTEHDKITVTGTATLGGTLNVTVGYSPANCDNITFIQATGISGTFAIVNVPSGWVVQYNFPSAGNVSLSYSPAEINVQGNSQTIADGDASPSSADHTDFGIVCSGSNQVRTYTIQNTGNSDLTVSSISTSGTDAAMFTVGALTPASPIPAGNNASFSVTFTPTSPGLKSATVHISNSDCDEADYDFAVQGTELPAVNNGTITSSDETICYAGDPANITLSISPSGGAGTFDYQWYYQNGLITCPTGTDNTGWTAISGATNSSYNPSFGLTASRTYAVQTDPTGSPDCGASSWASGCRKVTVLNFTDPGIVAFADQTICYSGDPSNITFQTPPSGGTGVYTYQWYYQNGIISCPIGTNTSGWTLISGATNSSYDPPSGLTTSRTYAVQTDDVGPPNCASAMWATGCRKVTVLTVVNNGTLSGSTETICNGGDPSTISFATAPSGGDGTFSYQWYYQDGIVSCPSGTNTSGWTLISGATNSSYDPPAGLTTERTYAVQTDPTGFHDCGVATWASGCNKVTLLNAIINGTVSGGDETICYGGDPANITLSTPPSGGTGTFGYQWYYQNGLITCPTGTDITGWTAVSGATNSSYNPPVSLTASRTYAVQTDPTGSPDCGAPSWASGCRKVTVLNFTDPGLVAFSDQSICYGGDPSNITFQTLPSGGTGIYTYQWYYQDGLVSCPSGNASGWTLISGATNSSYDPPSGLITSRTYAVRTDDVGPPNCAPELWASNCRKVTVNSNPSGGSFSVSPSSGCSLTSFTLTASDWTDTNTPLMYQFFYEGGPLTSLQATNTANVNLPAGTWNVYCVISNSAGCTTISSPVIVTVSNVTSGTWLGNVSVDWNDAANWCGGVPTSATDVVIPSGGTMPEINASAFCHDLTIDIGATLTINGSNNLTLTGDLNDYGTFVPNQSTVTLAGVAIQELLHTTFYNLTINNPAGVVLHSGKTITGTLTLQQGTVTTGLYTMIITSTANVVRIDGWVNGNLQRYVPTGSNVVESFDIGDDTHYLPVTITFASVSVAGNLTGHTNTGNHPNISTSNLNENKSVPSYWTFGADGALEFTTYDATFSWPSGYIDGGADPSLFVIGKFDE